MNTITNISAFIGLTIIIKNAPTIQPINAPNIGISAVKAIKTPIKSAYGNRIIDNVTKNIVPKINASRLNKNETIESARSYVEVVNTIYDAKLLPVVPRLSAELDKEYILKADKSFATPASVTVGVDETNTDDKVIALIDKVPSDGFGEYELELSSGMYIPEDNKKVKYKLDIEQNF